ncbi:MAG: DUF4160 domain-containing protein [Candidatus Sericytochromatia bacterium]|nr:DUF4160 domain-containing protein [Candidatus Sericytochromatia bacterium]
MPTVLSEGGFEVVIYTTDRMPPHVHVWRGGCEVAIHLGDADTRPKVDGPHRLKRQELRAALELVARHQAYLLRVWEMYHG